MIKAVVKSYSDNFKSPLGAYAYLLLNQQFPEIFNLTTKEPHVTEAGTSILEGLKKIDNVNDIMETIQNIPDTLYSKIVSLEQTINKNTVSDLLSNLEDISSTITNWTSIESIINYNSFSEFITHDKQQQMLLVMTDIKNKYHFASLSLNPNFKSEEFIKDFPIELENFCNIMDLTPEQIGLNSLNVNYQTEEGDFTGYVSSDNQSNGTGVFNYLVIKKSGVFAHEWLHFAESALGVAKRSITDLCKIPDDLKKDVSEFSEINPEVFEFEKYLTKKDEQFSDASFKNAVSSLGHFLEKYAIDKNNYYNNLKNIADKTSNDIQGPKSKNSDDFINEISSLLNPGFPPRYFSFLKAQYEIFETKVAQHKLEQNHFMDFAKKADNHLQSNDYTASFMETFARTFESFAYDKAKEKGISCKLLAKNYESDFYPQGSFKDNMNDYWSIAWPAMKKQLDRVIDPKKLIMNNIHDLRNKMAKQQSSVLNYKP